MDEAELVHRLETLGRLDENVDDRHHVGRRAHVERLAVHQLHDQIRFGHFQQQRLDDLQLVGPAKIRMIELAGKGILRFHLFDEADVLGVLAQHVLERKGFARRRIDDGVNRTPRTFSQSLHNLVMEECLGH